MSMVRLVTRIIPKNAPTDIASKLLTADQIDVPVRTQWTTSDDVVTETTFCKVDAIPPFSDPDVAIAAKCKNVPGLSCLKKSRLRLVTVENPAGESQPVMRVAPEVSPDGTYSGILLSIPLRIPRSEIHGSNVELEAKDVSGVSSNEPNQNSHVLDGDRTHFKDADVFRCDQCNKTFQSQVHLQYHKTTHRTKPQFKCDRCGKKFQGKKKLVLHAKTCGEDNLVVKCPFCNLRFKNGKQLKCHMSVHAGELPYQCVVCQERFRYARTLLDHSRQHKREKRFECVVCGTGFHKETLLQTHYSSVHNEEYSNGMTVTNGES